MAVTVSNSAYILKTLYPNKRVENLVYQDHPLLAMMPKNEEFYGENLVIPVRYADTQGRSSTFADAQSGIGAHAGKKFVLTRSADYALFSLTTEAIKASKNDRGAFIKNLDTEVESALNNFAKSTAQQAYGDGSGAVGRGSISGSTCTLANINDIVNIEVGMRLAASDTSTGALRDSGAVITVVTVDRDAGTFTFSGSISGFTANDYLFPKGDAANNGSIVRMSGLLAWIPTSAPGATSFFGVDRTADVTRLGGMRIDVSGLNPEEGLITALSKQAREGARPSHAFTNHLDFRNIEIAMGAKVTTKYAQVGEIGFTGVEVIGPKGPVMLHADQDAPSGRLFSLQLNTWTMYTLEKYPQILDEDGSRLSREASADRWEGRIGGWGNFACRAPGYNANVTMPS